MGRNGLYERKRVTMHAPQPIGATHPACRRRRLGGEPSSFTMYGPSKWYPSLR